MYAGAKCGREKKYRISPVNNPSETSYIIRWQSLYSLKLKHISTPSPSLLKLTEPNPAASLTLPFEDLGNHNITLHMRGKSP